MSNFESLLAKIKKIPNIKRTVITDPIGTILAYDEKATEEDGALAALLVQNGNQIGPLFQMYNLEMLSTTCENERIIIFSRDEILLFLIVEKQTSAAKFRIDIDIILKDSL